MAAVSANLTHRNEVRVISRFTLSAIECEPTRKSYRQPIRELDDDFRTKSLHMNMLNSATPLPRWPPYRDAVRLSLDLDGRQRNQNSGLLHYGYPPLRRYRAPALGS